MTMEQTLRAQELSELRAELPRILVGALAAALLGAGAMGIALWATNPPTHVPRGDAESATASGLFVDASLTVASKRLRHT